MKTSRQHIQISSKIPEEFDGKRLDQVCAQLFPEYSRSLLQKWIRRQWLTVDQQHLSPKDKVFAQQTICINAELEDQQNWEAQPISLNILFEDDDLILLNKPAGIVVHPGAGNPDHTLVNALLFHEPNLNKLPRAGIVHRLDKATSGIMVIAKTLKAYTFLVDQIQQRKVKREYEAIVNGVMISGGTVHAPIGRHPVSRTKMAVVHSGKEAITHYRIIESFRAHTHLKVQLETGRTHQIRVHMAHLHHPIVGDPEYGRKSYIPAGILPELKTMLQHFPRQALHAKRLTLQHPETLEILVYEAPLPEDMEALITMLRKDKAVK